MLSKEHNIRPQTKITGLSTLSTPDVPVIRIQPSKGWVSLKLYELWEYRELLYFLIWRDVKVRYKQTVLGAAWAIILLVAVARAFPIISVYSVNSPPRINLTMADRSLPSQIANTV